MEGFIHRFEALNPHAHPDDGFDHVIDLDPTKDSRENLETVISQLNATYPKLFTDMPSGEDLDDAITTALSEYKPEIRHEIGKNGGPKGKGPKNQPVSVIPDDLTPFGTFAEPLKKQQPKPASKPRPLEYISVNLPKGEIENVLDETFASVSSNKARFFRQLQESQRVQVEFHVTLIHRASSKQHPELWERYHNLHLANDAWENRLGECQVQLERIVWDSRIMAIVARIVGEEWPCSNEIAHVTVGTRGDDVKPKESNEMLKRWAYEGSGDSTGIGEIAIQGGAVIKGIVKAVASR
jgi:tRNA ligase